MASKEELTEQLAVTQKLAAAVDQMAKSMSRVESSYDSQITAVEKLTRALEQLKGTDLSGLNSTKLDNVQKEFKETEKQATSLTGRLKDMANWMSKKFPTSAAAAAGAVSGFVQGMRNVLAIGKGVTGFLGGLIDTLGSVAASIIAIPFKMFNALVDMAAQAGGGANELAQAMENLRKEFGAFAGPTPKTIITMSTSLKGFSDTGLSAFRVFGNLAERIEAFTKLAVAMGATFQNLTKEFQKNGGAILAYQKGLGISDEQMAAFGQKAIAQGTGISDVLKDTAKYALELGKAFGIDSKVISKDMAKAMVDVKHFAGATVKQIGEAATYARKLGVELDKITGTLDAFETFDSAAENAAKLSQSFGATVDAFKLMEAQSPAEQLDILRKSMLAAGKSADTMSRQELKLLAQTTGLDEATAKMAFSAKNQGLSLDEIKKKSGDAEKKTLTQAEAMSKLADSIERLVKSGGQQTGGFFDMFVKGFLGGIQSSKEFREIIWNIKKSLQLVYFEGVRLGRAFVEMFPGVKDFLGGIADFFNPAKFKRLVGGVVDILKDWMKGLTDPNGKASFADLMDKLQKKFFGFFDEQDPAGKKMLGGFKTILKTISRVMAEAIKWMADKMGEGIVFIIDLLTGKKTLGGLGGAAEGGLGFLADILKPLGDALAHAWTVLAPKVWELIKTLGKKLWEYLTSDQFINFVKPALPYIAAALFGPALVRSLMGALVSSIGKAAIGALTGGGAKALESVAQKAAQKVLDAGKKAAASGGEGLDKVATATKGSNNLMAEEKKGNWGVKDAVKLGLKLVAIAGALAIGGVMMAYSIAKMKKVMDEAGISKPEDIYPQLLTLGAMVLAALPLMLALKLADKVGKVTEILKGGAVIAIAVGIVGLVGAGLAWVMKQAGTPAELQAAGTLMLKMALVFLAMVPLIFASMAIGALASGPQAIALAAAAIGLGVIGVAVGEMAVIAVGIVKELAKMRIDAQFQQKIDAFLGVMKAIQAFTDSLVKIIDLCQPSFTELLMGTGESFTDKIGAAEKVIKSMIGQRGGKGGIIGLMETVMSQIKQLSAGGPEMAESAKIFGEIFTVLTEFMKAAQPPEAFYTAGTDFIEQLNSPGHSFDNLAVSVGFYMTKVINGAMDMADKVIGVINKLKEIRIPEADIKSTEAVANLFSTAVKLMQTLMPPPDVIKQFENVHSLETKGLGFVSTKETVKSFDSAGLVEYVKTIATKFGEIIPLIIGGAVQKLVDMSKGLKPAELENVKTVATIFNTIITLMNAMADIGKSFGGQVTTVKDSDVQGISKTFDVAPQLASVIVIAGRGMVAMFRAITTLTKEVPDTKDFKGKLDTTTKIFGLMGVIPKMAADLAGAAKGASGGGTLAGGVAGIISSAISGVVDFLSGKGATQGGTIGDLVTSVKTVSKQLPQDVGATAGALDNITKFLSSVAKAAKAIKDVSTASKDATIKPEDVSTLLTGISNTLTQAQSPITSINATLGKIQGLKGLGDKLEDYVSFLNKATTAAKVDGLAKSLTAVSDMVKLANDLDATLNAGLKIDTPVKLGKIASAVGLGGKFNYTIRNKEVVINMNVQVTMNVDEVEKVLILRKNSFVRDRINLALGEENKNAILPDTRESPIQVPFAKGQSSP